MSKPALALLAIAALISAVLAASWFPAHPALAGAIAYAATVLTLARATHMPPARTLGATVLLTLAAAAVLLQGARYLLDVALWILGSTGAVGVGVLRAKAAS